IVGLVKYLDQRKREERTARFRTFHELMGPIVARGERPNEGLALSQQVAAVYELQHFKDYSYASVPILEDLRARWEKEKETPQLLLRAIDDTLKVLQQKTRWRRFLALVQQSGE